MPMRSVSITVMMANVEISVGFVFLWSLRPMVRGVKRLQLASRLAIICFKPKSVIVHDLMAD